MNAVTQLSPAGGQFIAAHESPGGRAVTRAYRCPAGVITIGHGFTMRSKVFAAWWTTKHGRALRLGDTISQADADMLLIRLVNEEYGKEVVTKIRPKKPHHFDGASSVSFNCGPGSLGWKWAIALRDGKPGEAATRLRTTAVTANGRRLAGLVRRRAEEAELIEHGRYKSTPFSNAANVASSSVEEIKEYQTQLIALGYDLGPSKADGFAGTRTKAAVRAFQKKHGLVVDGVVGPATRSTLLRALDTKRGTQAAGSAGGVGAVGTALPADLASQPTDVLLSSLAWGVGAAAVIAVVVLAFKYRGLVTGRRVPV